MSRGATLRDRDVRHLKPYVMEWIAAATRSAGGSSVVGSVSGSNFSKDDALNLFYTKAQDDAWRVTHEADENIHHARLHSLVSAADHAIPAGANALDVLGVASGGSGLVLDMLSPASDVRTSGQNSILRDAAGILGLAELQTPMITSDADLTIDAVGKIYTDAIQRSTNYSASVGSSINWSAGDMELMRLTANAYVFTPLLSTGSGDLEIAPAGDVVMDGVQRWIGYTVEGAGGVKIDWPSGYADFGDLHAQSAHVRGAATVEQDLIIGPSYATPGVLFVDASALSIGVNRAPDPQFALDISGPARADWWIGPHAIQLKDAIFIAHFDGPRPYYLDFSGFNTGHMGQSGVEFGGVIYRPGKFNKAVQVAPGATNLLTNPSFEVDTANWFNDGLTLTLSQKFKYVGENSLKVALEVADTGHNVYTADIILADGQSVTASAYFYVPYYSTAETVKMRIHDYTNGVSYWSDSVDEVDQWVRRTVTLTNNTGADITYRVLFYIDGVGSSDCHYLIDAAQLEATAYATPYLDGDMGDGYTWAGTPHASTSTRTGGTIVYSEAMVNADRGTIMAWVKSAGITPNGRGLFGTGSNAQFDAYIDGYGALYFRMGTVSLTVGASNVPASDWMHVAFTWSKSDNFRKIYVNGIERASGTYVEPTLGNTFYIGSITAGGNYSINGWIDDFVILDDVADADKVRSIYESNAPVFAESSVFAFRAPTRSPVWVDEEGLWMQSASGNPTLGVYGANDPNGKSWGGLTLYDSDFLLGNSSAGYLAWWSGVDENSPHTNPMLELAAGDGAGLQFDSTGLVISNARKFEITSGANTIFEVSNLPSMRLGNPAPAAYSAGVGLWAGIDAGLFKAQIGDANGDKLLFDGNGLSVRGTFAVTGDFLTINPSSGIQIVGGDAAFTWTRGYKFTDSNDVPFGGMIGYRSGGVISVVNLLSQPSNGDDAKLLLQASVSSLNENSTTQIESYSAFGQALLRAKAYRASGLAGYDALVTSLGVSSLTFYGDTITTESGYAPVNDQDVARLADVKTRLEYSPQKVKYASSLADVGSTSGGKWVKLGSVSFSAAAYRACHVYGSVVGVKNNSTGTNGIFARFSMSSATPVAPLIYMEQFPGVDSEFSEVRAIHISGTGTTATFEIWGKFKNNYANIEIEWRYRTHATNVTVSFADLSAGDLQSAPPAGGSLGYVSAYTGDWFTLPFGSGWQDYSSSYTQSKYRRIGDIVELKGMAARVSGTGTVIATLPVGWRPPRRAILFPITSGGAGRVDVQTNGDITWQGGGTDWVVLNGLRFSTSD